MQAVPALLRIGDILGTGAGLMRCMMGQSAGFGNSAGQNDVSLGGDNRACDVDADAGICAEAEIWTG